MTPGPRFLRVEAPLILQFGIALFTGMVASTFVPQVRRAIPRPVEVAMWLGLIGVCVAGIVSVTDRHARELTSTVVWAAEQLINTLAGLLGAGVAWWISDHRFAIATMIVIVAGLDLIALGLLRSWRAAARLEPRVRLREWMEVPRLEREVAAQSHPSRLDVAARRVTAASTFVAAWFIATSLTMAIWLRDTLLPREAHRLSHAAAVGRVQSKAGLESLRDTAAQVQFAARAWYEAAAAPAMSAVALHAVSALRAAAAARREAYARDGKEGRVVDVQALLGWYDPPMGDPTGTKRIGVEKDGAEPRSDRLAS